MAYGLHNGLSLVGLDLDSARDISLPSVEIPRHVALKKTACKGPACKSDLQHSGILSARPSTWPAETGAYRACCSRRESTTSQGTASTRASSAAGHETFAAAAQWLTSNARDGVRAPPLSTRGVSSRRASLLVEEPPLTCRPKRSSDAALHEERLIRAVCEQIQLKACQKYRSVREALRFVDGDHDGTVDRNEMRYFIRHYDFGPEVSDRVFNYLCREGAHEIVYADFIRFFGQYINDDHFNGFGNSAPTCPGHPVKTDRRDSCSTTYTETETPSEPSKPLERVYSLGGVESEFKDMLKFIGAKAAERWSNTRHAFRYVDGDKDGSVDQEEMRSFFRAFNLPAELADRFHARLDVDGNGEVPWDTFIHVVGPHIQPDNSSAKEPVQRQATAASRRMSAGAGECAATKNMMKELKALSNMKLKGASSSLSDTGSQMETDFKQLKQVMKRIGEKLPLKFKHPRDAFRYLDLERNGRITRTQMRSFFRQFGELEQVADQVFDMLKDIDSEHAHGEVDFSSFMMHFDSLLGPAFRQAQREPLIDVADPRIEKDVNELAVAMRLRMVTKYKSFRDAFRSLDLNKDGGVSREENRVFFRSFGMLDTADNFFDALDVDGSGNVGYDEFVAVFAKDESALRTPKPQFTSKRVRHLRAL